MSGNDSTMFFDQLAALSRLEPTEDACRAALEGTRAEILQAAARRRKRRFWMRISIPSGIAAAAVAAALLVTVLPGSQKASAADQLAQAVEATTAFKGWVHWTQVIDAGVAKATTGPANHIKKATKHLNSAQGMMADVIEFDDDLEVDLTSIAKHETAEFHQKTGEVCLRTISDDESKVLEKMAPPTTVADVVAKIKAHLGRDPVSVKETPDGDSMRFDIVLFDSAAEAEKFRESQGERMSIGTGLSVWVNRDKLITRLRMEPPSGESHGQGVTTMEVSYGPPEIKDIYDLGVPREAKVVDMRMNDLQKQGPGSDLEKLAARLDDRRLTGLGDGVALLSSYVSDSTGRTVNTRSGNVTLYASQGDKWIANQYLLFLDQERPHLTPVLKAAPVGWPNLDARTLVPVLRSAVPQVACVMIGDHGWYGSPRSANVLSAATDHDLLEKLTLGSVLWPSRQQSGMSVGTLKSKLQDDLLRLRYKGMTTGPDGTGASFETTYLLDLAKDDLPREWYRNTIKPETGELVERTATHYLNFDHLPDGRWYPTDWTSQTIQREPASGNDNGYVTVSHLQVFPGMKIDEGWFADPRGNVATTTAK